MLDKIPFIRGCLARMHNRRMRSKQLSSYTHMLRCVKETSVSSILFEEKGCAYTLKDGRSFYFDPNKSAGWLYSVPFTGTFEDKETEFVRHTIQRDWICFDIGACFGWYSILISKLIDQGHVHAFEPVPDNRDCCQANLALNGCSNVMLNPFALGEQSATTEIFIPNDGVSGSLRAHAKLDRCKVISVDVSTIDKYVATSGLKRLDFIKADIEGAEFLMLKGAEESLRKYKPMLMLEIQAHSTRLFGYKPEDIFRWLNELGYKAYYVGTDYELVECDIQWNRSNLPDYNFVFKCEA